MKVTNVLALVMILSVAPAAGAQYVQQAAARSAEAISRMEAMRDMWATVTKPKAPPPADDPAWYLDFKAHALHLRDFKVGVAGFPVSEPRSVKIIQILDHDRMLIRIDNRLGKESKMVMLKCPTKGHVDDETFDRWSDLIGEWRMISIPDTVSYTSTSGARCTVLLVELEPAEAVTKRLERWRKAEAEAKKKAEEEAERNKVEAERQKVEAERRNAEAKAEAERQKAEAKAKAEAKRKEREEVRKKEEAEAKKKAEQQKAAAYLAYAKKLVDRGDFTKAKERLAEIVKDFPDTAAGSEAKELKDLLEKAGK
jgi:hypothetical protein